MRHIADPLSYGNTHGGPVSVVHKHSRAIAFSIFRKYDLFRQTRQGHTSMPTSSSILLATKRVQEQYTSTRTTNQLKEHGLLRDGDSRTRAHGESGNTSASESGPSGRTVVRSASTGANARERPNANSKGKGKEPRSDSPSHTSSAGSVTSRSTANEQASLIFARTYASSSSSDPSVPITPTVADAQDAYSSSGSSAAVRHSIDVTSKYGSPPPTASSSAGRSPPHVDSMAIDDYEERMPPRTSHAEAFATIFDQSSIEYFRGGSDQRSSEHDLSHSRSITERLRRRLLGQNFRPSQGPPSAALEGRYTPPWLTMAPRSRVEERDRVIQNLNESFKDVGLLPSFKTKGMKPRHHRPNETVNIFSHVPADSLHMLLPLWPGETDSASVVLNEDPSSYSVPVEERQYLLVYYVPFDERKEKSKKQDSKKRSRSGSHVAVSSSGPGASKTILLTSFSVRARLISYQDLLGTGVRLPIEGLSVAGSMAEAMRLLPSSAIRETRLETPWAIIGICNSRNKGVEFLPEGLAKVGLAIALPSPSPEPVQMSSEAEEPEINWELTPIGRAAVEMAWLGCLAMTSFGPESPTNK